MKDYLIVLTVKGEIETTTHIILAKDRPMADRRASAILEGTLRPASVKTNRLLATAFQPW